MTLDIGNFEGLRKILKVLHTDYKVSSENLLNQCQKYIGQQNSIITKSGGLNTFSIAELPSRSQLDKFINGTTIKKITGLIKIQEYLEQHSIYKNMFVENNQDKNESLSSDELMSLALRRYFSEAADASPSYKVDDIRQRLVGKYKVYRPAWRKGVPEKFFQTSLMEITNRKNSTCVTETQKTSETIFLNSIVSKYDHIDAGFIFTFGHSVYFLMKQINEGTAVKMWVFSSVEPYDKGSVSSFHGVMYPTSTVALFGSVMFFCRKITEEEALVFNGEYLEISNIKDAAAVSVLQNKFPLRFGS